MTIKLFDRYTAADGEELVKYEVSGRPGHGELVTEGKSDADVIKGIEEFEALVAKANKDENRGDRPSAGSLSWRMDAEAGAASCKHLPPPTAFEILVRAAETSDGPLPPPTDTEYYKEISDNFYEDAIAKRDLNFLLRYSPNPPPKALQFRDLLNASLAKQPVEPALKNTPLYRRLCLNSSEQSSAVMRYRPGDIVTEGSFTSTNTSSAISKFADKNVLFIIYSHSGRKVPESSGLNLSKLFDGKEVLIPAGATFKVSIVLQDPGEDYPYLTICLKEVE